VPVQKSGKMSFQGTKKYNFWWQHLSRDDGLQLTNEHLLIIAVFGRTSPAIGDRIKEKLYFYAACLRASVSKLADTMEAHT